MSGSLLVAYSREGLAMGPMSGEFLYIIRYTFHLWVCSRPNGDNP